MMSGGVTLKIEGVNISQFFSRVKRMGIILYDIQREDYRTLCFRISCADFKKVKEYLYKFFVVTVLQRHGMSKIRHVSAKNVGILMGVFLTVLLYFYTSSMVWKIEIFGNTITPSTHIMQLLKEHNVRVGGYFDVDIIDVANDILRASDTLAEVSIERRGNTVLVNVSEKLFFAPVEYMPILSTHDAVVRSIDHMVGTLRVKVGDFVKTGQRLVEPYILTPSGDKVDVKPLASITLEAYIVSSYTQPKTERSMIYTGRTHTIRDILLGKTIINKGAGCKSFEFSDKVVYNQNISYLVLPLVMKYTIVREITFEDKVFTLQDCKDSLTIRSRAACELAIPPSAKLLSMDTVFFENSAYYTATTTASVSVNV